MRDQLLKKFKEYKKKLYRARNFLRQEDFSKLMT